MGKTSPHELVVPYDPIQKVFYRACDPRCRYHDAYPSSLWHGIYRHGRFADVVVRDAFLELGYRVLISDPEMPNDGGYMLTHYAGKRADHHEAFIRMFNHFPRRRIAELNRQCDRLKLLRWGSRGGGDPDLFVIGSTGRAFFVEVKDRDQLKPKQRAIFAKIRTVLGCDVRIARIKAVSGADPAVALREQLAG